jgi:hypothetical protein
MGHKISLGMLLIGAALLWAVPLGGALLVVTAAVGLAITSESELPPVVPREVVVDLTDLGAEGVESSRAPT